MEYANLHDIDEAIDEHLEEIKRLTRIRNELIEIETARILSR